MNQNTFAEAQLGGLRDCLERILLSSTPSPDAENRLTLFNCYGLASALAERAITFRTHRLDGDVLERLVEGCRQELAPLAIGSDEATGRLAKRLVPHEISEDEMTLRWLLSTIERYLEGLEPEYVALPVHQLNRAMCQARLMQVWDVADAKYQRTLRLALNHLEQAIFAAMCAPRN
ncbi:hypothetical protein [Lysobacter sp. CA199]|uniref:hypothetical protein n=1 Tax=Lysobacter sp. CA199 TaxID=3455608 RepID=UPI003F8D6B6E